MPTLEAARAALEKGDFRGALVASRALEESVDALEIRAAAAYGAGEFEAAVSSWERLHTLHAAAGRHEEAAWAAARVALNLLCETGLLAPVRGWVGRAHHHLDGLPTGRVHALLAITRAYERFLSGDPASALEPALEAVELGTAFGVDPARGLGRVAVARLAIHAGDVDGGIALLDELAVALGLGEFDPLTTGNVYCELICAAQWLGRHDRAREWTEIMERWRHGPGFGAAHGRCRVHRAELLRVSGPAHEAEDEALAACAELRPWLRRELGWPLVELGNIRLRRGDLPGAEAAYVEAHERAWSPQPGLALLRLAQGETADAAAMIRCEIDHPADVPWKERPPFGDLRLVPLLAAQAEIAASGDGDAEVAASAAAALSEILQRYPSAGLRAAAGLARARAALVAGAPAGAIGPAREVVAIWVELEAPYDAAVARLVAGEALLALGDPGAARLEWRAARAAFESFGAEHQVVAVDERLAALAGVAARSRADARPVLGVAELLRRGEHWALCFGGAEVVLPDLKGLHYLARLLAEPGRELAALELAAAGAVVEAGLPVLDDEAKAAYRRRLREVEEDIDEAIAASDLGRRQLAERDKEYLVAELTRAVGLGGRSRTTGGTAERARTAVTRTLRYALTRVAEVRPDLGRHLDHTVRTGAWCSYQPDPLAPVTWRVESR